MLGFIPRSLPFPAGGTTAGAGGGTGGTGGGGPGGGPPGPCPDPGGGGGPLGCPPPDPPGGGGLGKTRVVGWGVVAWELEIGVPGSVGFPPTLGRDVRGTSGFWREPSATSTASARRRVEGQMYPLVSKKLSEGVPILDPGWSSTSPDVPSSHV